MNFTIILALCFLWSCTVFNRPCNQTHDSLVVTPTLFTLLSPPLPLLLSLSLSLHDLSVYVISPHLNPNLSLFNHAIRCLSKSATHSHVSLSLYARMTPLSIRPDNFTFSFLLNSCASLTLFFNGTENHYRAVKSGHCKNIHVSNAFIDMDGKCGSFILARKVFDEIPIRNVVSYNAILGAHARVGEDMVSAKCPFNEMPDRNVITWNAMIVGYVTCGELSKASKIFDEMPSRNILSWSFLIMGYCKCRLLDDARGLFDRIPSKNLVSWSLMITGFSQVGRPQEAMSLIYEMDKMGFTPDAAIITGVISAAAKLGEAELANPIGGYVDRKNIKRNERVLTSLIDMHAKCGNVEQALHLIDEIINRDAFAYAAVINGLASHGHGVKALEIYDRMREEGLVPDDIVFVGVLRACSHAGLADKGLE